MRVVKPPDPATPPRWAPVPEDIGRERLLETLCSCQPCTWEDLLSLLGGVDKRRLRHLLADLIREGVVAKRPNYERRKLEYVVTGGCRGQPP